MWLLLFYALLPQIIFAAVVAAAITLAVFRRKSLFLSIPLVLSLAAWVYVELRVRHWQMDEICAAKARLRVSERMFDVTSIHFQNDDCWFCWEYLANLGYSEVQFTPNQNEDRHYRMRYEPIETAMCDSKRDVRHWAKQRRPDYCITVAPVSEVTAPVSILHSHSRERRILGEIENWRTSYLRRSDGYVIAERNQYRWWARGILSYFALRVTSGSLDYGEFICPKPGSPWQEMDQFISPHPQRQ